MTEVATRKEPETEDEIIRTYNVLRQEQSKLMSRIAEIEGERHEHALVVDTLKPLDPERKCHRLVGGVLVERTVATVTPEVENALIQIDTALKNFNDQLMRKDKELETFMMKYKINGNKGMKGEQVAAAKSEEGTRGVLA